MAWVSNGMGEARPDGPGVAAPELRVVADGPTRTAEVAAALAGRLIEGDVVLLTGGLAAGKTTFVTAVAAALGSVDAVTSPTFALAQFYTSAAGPILHVDAYRLDGIAEYRDLALDDYVATSVTLVEWGERIAAEFPCHLRVELAPSTAGADVRDITFTSSCARWTAALPGLHHELAGAPS